VVRPLVVWKGTGGAGSDVVVPHLNWRGLFGRGTDAIGNPTGITIEWPGFQTTAYHSMGPTQAQTRTWMGSLLEGQRDAGGQMYMRNRYYDPATGQFTQPDPIGIAGGLNVYGFAAGDPISYSDPYGLKVVFIGETKEDRAAARQVWDELRNRASDALNSSSWNTRWAARRTLRLMDRAEASDKVYAIAGVDLNAHGGGTEGPDPENANQHLIQIDPNGSPGQKASPWIILAHELGGALGGPGHALPALQAENWARTIAGCWPRWGHGTPAYASCHR
jgi:RHS repeat-associated protein